MAIAPDTVSGSIVLTAGTSVTTNTATHVVGASATAALLFIEASLQGSQNDSGISFTQLTLGSGTFTHLGSALVHSGGGTTGFVDVYTLLTPPTGSQTLTVKMSGGTGNVQNLLAFSVSYTGTLQSGSEFGTAKTVNGSFASSQTITDTLASGDLFVGVCCNGTAAPTMTTGTSDATATGDGTTSSHGGIRVAHNSGTGSISLVFATNSADNEAASGVKLVASTGGGDPFPAGYNPAIAQQTVYRL